MKKSLVLFVSILLSVLFLSCESKSKPNLLGKWEAKLTLKSELASKADGSQAPLAYLYTKQNITLAFAEGGTYTRKILQIVDKVDLIQSVDSVKLAREISNQSVKRGKKTDILVEVNIGREENKSGVFEENLEELLCQIAELEGISVKGLMTIPPICENEHKISKYFYNMHKLFIDISEKKLDNVSMNILSMGMSADFYEAILEGANMVRIGSALFGARNYT